MSETMSEKHTATKTKEVVITVVNEDSGRDFKLREGRCTLIKTVIEHMYDKLKVERKANDRLRCESTNQDVFAFAELHLIDYLEEGHCPDLVWLFAGETGGA